MSFSLALRRAIPPSLKNFLRQRTTPWRVSALVSRYLPPVVCIDVGASYYPHAKWLVFLNSPRTHWLAVEPNEANIGYVASWVWPCKVSTCTTGLSRGGGTQTLYVTNVDSGSSLLPPEITASMQHRVRNLDYFFPLRERAIDTITLEQAQRALPQDAPMFVKLDTQGSELSILQGAQGLFTSGRIMGIEMESTMQAQPIMKGAGKFWEASQFLEAQGFELLTIKPIHAASPGGRLRPHRMRYLNECDAVFALRRDVAATRPVAHRASLFAFYLSYQFYQEAHAVLESDTEVRALLAGQQCPVDRLLASLEVLS